MPKPERRPAGALRGKIVTWAVVALLVLGFIAGLVTGLQATQVVYVGSVHLWLGSILAFAATFGFGTFAGWGLRTREAAVFPGFGWLLGVLALILLPSRGGDILVPGSGGEVYGFLAAGLVGVILAVLAAWWLLRPRRIAPPTGTDDRESPATATAATDTTDTADTAARPADASPPRQDGR